MTIIERLPQWRRDKAKICDRILNHITPFKILIKTKDEPDRLKAWIAHHSGIVGLENLIIFDNMSADQAVLEIYAKFEFEFPIVRFDGFLDTIHRPKFFGELYAALRLSCKHYIFLDTDEFLVLYDGADSFSSDKHILEFLHRRTDIVVFPGTWLQNVRGYNNRFMLEQSGRQLRVGLQWGKPIISSAFDVSGIINHNTQIKHAMSETDLVTNFFVLHRNCVLPSERIRINLHKLRAHNQLKPGEGLNELLALDVESMTAGRNYAQEIRELVSVESVLPSTEDSFEINSNGTINWSNQGQRAELQNFLDTPSAYSYNLFSGAE